MQNLIRVSMFLGIVSLFAMAVSAQQQVSTGQAVPGVVRFSGTLTTSTGQPLSGTVGVTFALYAYQQGGTALWMDTQNVSLDEQGRYTVLLGASSSTGIPSGVFASNQANWLGVQVQGQEEQLRVLLVSVPYALKAADSDTVGGLPVSAFVLAQPIGQLNSAGTGPTASANDVALGQAIVSRISTAVAGTGTANIVPLWLDTNGALGNSDIYDNGSGLLGVGTTTPGTATGMELHGGNANLIVSGTGTHSFAVQGDTSSGRLGQDLEGFFFASDTGGKVLKFLTTPNAGSLTEWMRVTSTGNVGIGTTTPAQALDVAGNINASGNLTLGGTFNASGMQSFSGLGTFTAAPTGSGVGQGSLYVDPVTASAGQTLVGAAVGGTQEFKVDSGGNVSAAGDINLPNTNGAGTAGVITLGGNPFLHNYGPASAGNTFVGQSAGNFTMTGIANTGTGSLAFASNTTGSANTAIGNAALQSNTTGSDNTAIGDAALRGNSTGSGNTASGWGALVYNTTGSANTASGLAALESNTTGGNNTADGYAALNANTIGVQNTASGQAALTNNSTGSGNTAGGAGALNNNTTGLNNTAGGLEALFSNTTGSNNAALGWTAGYTSIAANANTTGSNNTFIGYNAGPGVPTEIDNATAIGAQAVVSANNSMVLGSINGVNGAVADTRVGIGESNGLTKLTVKGSAQSAGSGTISVGAGTSTVTGVGTKFLSELAVGDRITANSTGENRPVLSILSDTSFNSVNWTNGVSGSGFVVQHGLFRADDSGGTNRLMVRYDGNVGIGTSNPLTPLQVTGNAQFNNRTFVAPTSTLLEPSLLTVRGIIFNPIGGTVAVSAGSTTVTGTGTFFTTGVVGLGDRIKIGTSNEIRTVVSIASDTSLTVDSNFITAESGVTLTPMASLFRADDSSGNPRVLISDTGNVGVGTLVPSQKVEIVGNLKLDGAGNGLIFPDGTNQTTAAAGGGGGGGTVTSVGSGLGLTGGPITTSGTLSIDTSVVPQLNTANSFTGTQNITSGNLALPITNGSGTDGVITLGGNRFLHNFGTQNTFVGAAAGNFTMSGGNNTATGFEALESNSSGSNNTASGYGALSSNTTGIQNTAIGSDALLFNSTGGNNTASGDAALQLNSTGVENTASGGVALQLNSTGIENTALGYGAGVTLTPANANTTGSYNTFIGFGSGPGVASSSNLLNATAIGADAVVSASNALVLGSITGVNGATSNVNVGIGTATPGKALDVVGDVRASGCLIASGTAIGGTCSSDIRFKKNIQPFWSVLTRVAQLQPVTYDWRAEEFPEYHFGSTRATGLIAQDVEKVFPEMVSTDERGYKQVNYSQLPYLMLQAIRELKAENDTLRDQVEQLQKQQVAIQRLEEEVNRLKASEKVQPAALQMAVH